MGTESSGSATSTTARWDDYQAAYEEALRETSREWTPWYAIPADAKACMRAAVARVMVETIQSLDPQFPKLGADQRHELQEGLRRLEQE